MVGNSGTIETTFNHGDYISDSHSGYTQPSSASVPTTALTLSFGGVDFRLVPDVPAFASEDGSSPPLVSMLPPKIPEGQSILLKLSSFTGTLRVSLSKSNSESGNLSMTATVEEEDPESPPRSSQRSATPTSHTALPLVSPPPIAGQQQLPFVTVKENEKRKKGHISQRKNGKVSSSHIESENQSDAASNPFPSDKAQNSKLSFDAPALKRRRTSLSRRFSEEQDDNSLVDKALADKKTRRQKQEAFTVVWNELDEQQTVERSPTPTLGQAVLTQSTGNEVDDDIEVGQLGLAEPIPSNAKKPIPPNSSVKEIVRRAEDCSDIEGCGRNPDDDDEEHSVASSCCDQSKTKRFEEGTVMELDECLLAEERAGGVDTKAEITPSIPASIVKRTQPHPSPRWGHTMTLIDHGRIIVYGGQAFDSELGQTTTLSDLHVYDVAKRTWTKPVICEGVPRQWHTATFLPERQLLISFGGESANPKTGKITTTDQVMVLDTEIMLWYPPSVSGNVPSGRSGHTASLLPNTNELVVFGGVKGHKWQNSVAVLDTTRWKWSTPKISGSAPRPRSYHSATPIGGTGRNGNRLVIFGGNDGSSSFNTVHVLDASERKWSWYHPEVTGTVPPPRTGHCATLLEDNKTILVYGGWDPNAEDEEDASDDDDDEIIFMDSYLLDTESWTWSRGPQPKYLGAVSGNADSESVAKDGGPKRVGHRAVLACGEEGAQVLVFGGRVPGDQFAADFQTLVVPQSMVGLG